MIRVVGPEGTAEYRAAEAIRDALLRWWPAADRDPHTSVWLIASAQAFGQARQDVDIALFAEFGASAPQVQLPSGSTVRLQRISFTIELKTHLPEDVRFVGPQVEVRYGREWKNATKQAEDQMFALRKYIQQRANTTPYLVNLVWLSGVASRVLPPRPHNILGADPTWIDILVALSGTRLASDFQAGLIARGSAQGISASVTSLTAALDVTRLDRRRIERITERLVGAQRYATQLGEQLLVFRGRGGTGKTATLLRLAHDVYTEKGARVLLLTYNNALVSDIRRLLTLMKIWPTEDRPMISVMTVHSFILQVFAALVGGERQPNQSFDDWYAYVKRTLSELRPAVSREDLVALKNRPDGAFNWDFVLVDEYQDWPEDERDLMYWLYGAEKHVLADGVDQLTRQSKRADWLSPIPTSRRQVVPLNRTLRLKRNLCQFVQILGEHTGLGDLKIEPVPEQTGGLITIVEGDYLSDGQFHADVVALTAQDGNSPIDMLFVDMQSSDASRSSTAKESRAAMVFREWGQKAWDGFDINERKTFPTDVNQLRVVQYESCRGLEAWTTVCLNADRFYDRKLKEGRALSVVGELALEDPEERARRYAARWLMIPFTRAIDWLVICVSARDSHLGRLLDKVSAACGESVEWVRAEKSVATRFHVR